MFARMSESTGVGAYHERGRGAQGEGVRAIRQKERRTSWQREMRGLTEDALRC